MASNGYNELFNETLRDERLNADIFGTLLVENMPIECHRRYNTARTGTGHI